MVSTVYFKLTKIKRPILDTQQKCEHSHLLAGETAPSLTWLVLGVVVVEGVVDSRLSTVGR